MALDPPVPTATILLARVQNAVPAFDHGARLANNAVARRVVSPAAVAAIVIKTGAVPVPVPVRARRTPGAARVVSPHGIPRKTRKDRVRSVEIGPDQNPRSRLGLVDRQGYAALRGPAEG